MHSVEPSHCFCKAYRAALHAYPTMCSTLGLWKLLVATCAEALEQATSHHHRMSILKKLLFHYARPSESLHDAA